MCTCVTGQSFLLTLPDVEAFDGYWLVAVFGLVDNSPTATLAENITLLLRVLQPGLVQKEPTHKNRIIIICCLIFISGLFSSTDAVLQAKDKIQFFL